jgi:hypothetical protein
MDRNIWENYSPEGKMTYLGTYQSGGTPSLAISQFGQTVAGAPTQEQIEAYMPLMQQWLGEGATPEQIQRGAVAAAMGFNDYVQGMGQSADPFTQWQQQRAMTLAGQEDEDRLRSISLQEQQLAYQQQQAAEAAAAQRRAQAMALAESILGMQQQQWAQVSGWALPPGSQTAPGWEEGGAVAQMFAKQGLPYTPIQAVQTPGVDYAPAYAWAQQLLGGS